MLCGTLACAPFSLKPARKQGNECARGVFTPNGSATAPFASKADQDPDQTAREFRHLSRGMPKPRHSSECRDWPQGKFVAVTMAGAISRSDAATARQFAVTASLVRGRRVRCWCGGAD